MNKQIINHGMDITKVPSNFRIECKTVVMIQFKATWDIDMQNIQTYPISWTYNKIKCSFSIELYLYTLKNHEYGVVVAQLRTNSHTLAIGRGRYSRPKVQISDRTWDIGGRRNTCSYPLLVIWTGEGSSISPTYWNFTLAFPTCLTKTNLYSSWEMQLNIKY